MKASSTRGDGSLAASTSSSVGSATTKKTVKVPPPSAAAMCIYAKPLGKDAERERAAVPAPVAIDDDGSSPWVDEGTYLAVMHELQATVDDSSESIRSKAAHFVSMGAFKDSKRRHIPPSSGPKDLYTKPLTLGQEMGWTADLHPKDAPRHPRMASAETKHAAAMYSSGYI